MRKYMAPSDARCPGCGVVSNIRQVEPEDLGGRSPDAGVEIRTGESGPGDEIQTVTLVGTGSASRAARQQADKPPAKPWRVTVRYDDGSYASFDQGRQAACQSRAASTSGLGASRTALSLWLL